MCNQEEASLWDDPVQSQRRTHKSHQSDWRSLHLRNSIFTWSHAAEYVGPGSGWYMPTPWSQQQSFDHDEEDPVAGVYLIQSRQSGLVKVGWSKNVYRRLETLQTGSSEDLELIDVLHIGRTMERTIHEENSDLRVRGEWFQPEVIDRLLGV